MRYMGYTIIEDRNMVDRFQIRKHRKKRINKKWAKRYGFRVVPKKDARRFQNSLIMHPETAATFKKLLLKGE